jgi:16S rRNA (guanine527-N7)-methyltransferase
VKHRSSPAAPPDLASDRARALSLTAVSRETSERLDRFVELLLTWQRTTNLIAPSTIPHLWTRHIADSLQLLELAPDGRIWIDLGSGGGFPGLVIACALAGKPGVSVHLVESNAKKVAFLREAQRVTESPAIVHDARIEDFAGSFAGKADVVTARALAPLNLLFAQSFPLLGKSSVVGLFPKGQNAELELAEASKMWAVKVNLVPSRTEPDGRIVVVQSLAHRRMAP